LEERGGEGYPSQIDFGGAYLAGLEGRKGGIILGGRKGLGVRL